MGIPDLSLVTQTLLNLLECAFSTSADSKVGDISFSSQRPDQVKGNTVGLYLYHVVEDPGYKNLPAPEDASAHIRHSSMGLNLHYQLVCQYLSKPEVPETAIMEQNMMGIAMKTFHDFPIIDDRTTIQKKNPSSGITTINVLHSDLLGTDTRLKIELLPVDQKDAMGYWATSNTAPRLAAYYKVSIVVLKREIPATRPGRVLSYGVYSFPGGGPRIDGCSNMISYTLPGQIKPNEFDLSPAQVPVGNEVFFTGACLKGEKAELMLKYSRWDEFCTVDNSWNLKFTETGASITIQEKIPDGKGGQKQILPGIYSAKIKVTKRITLSDGKTGETEHCSNECPFVITPRIDGIGNVTEIVPDELYNSEIDGYLFSFIDPVDTPDQVTLNVYVGVDQFKQIKVGSEKESFKVVSDSKLTVYLPKLTAGSYPIRIFVNGAESPPNWITII
jgi:hypothetical protein